VEACRRQRPAEGGFLPRAGIAHRHLRRLVAVGRACSAPATGSSGTRHAFPDTAARALGLAWAPSKYLMIEYMYNNEITAWAGNPVYFKIYIFRLLKVKINKMTTPGFANISRARCVIHSRDTAIRIYSVSQLNYKN
jgi:hypothetical protein